MVDGICLLVALCDAAVTSGAPHDPSTLRATVTSGVFARRVLDTLIGAANEGPDVGEAVALCDVLGVALAALGVDVDVDDPGSLLAAVQPGGPLDVVLAR